MPKIESDLIVYTPTDRYLIEEVSPGITPNSFAALFNQTVQSGDTTRYYKFLSEITEKDPDVQQAIASRTSEITSKTWEIEGPVQASSDLLMQTLKDIKGDPIRGLISLDQLIVAFLDSAYLIGISVNEIVTDGKQIVGFNHIPPQFLTFFEAVHYPKLYTQTVPTGVEFNKNKMIIHYLNPGNDPVRGWLGHSVGIQYALKIANLEQRLSWQNRYGKGFLMVTMPGDKDSYDAAWSIAEDLVDNLYNVDGAVFPEGTVADFISDSGSEGAYFFESQDDFKKNITKIILGQTSTSDSTDSNRSTASVHMEVLKTRILQDIELIENTINTQLLPKVTQLLGLSAAEQYKFKFVISDIEAEMDDDMDNPEESNITPDVEIEDTNMESELE